MTMRAALSIVLLAGVYAGADVSHAEPAAAASAQPSLVSVMAELGPVLAQQRKVQGFPVLSPAQLAKAERGELVVREQAVAGAEVPRLTMATVMPYPVEAVYLVLGDLKAHADFIPTLDHSVILTQADRGMVREAFQFMGAPYPAQDRGWILRMENNRALYEASGGRYWEMPWTMMGEEYQTFLSGTLAGSGPIPAGLSREDLEDATTPRYGVGAWVLVPLGPNRTYVEYDSFTDPNANTIERGLASALGTKVQAGMFRALEPLADAYTQGKKKTTSVLVDMQGGSSNGLLDHLKQLLSSSPNTAGR